jgi:hypothetical protein
MSSFVSQFVRKAEEILNVATAGGNTLTNAAILIDRQGGLRMLDATGWSLTGLAAEYGAAAVYKIERRGKAVRVEGWNGSDRCLLQRGAPPSLLRLCDA